MRGPTGPLLPRVSLEELGRGVVGDDLAAGLTRRAVVDRVTAVLHGADGVAAHRTRLALAVTHRTRGVGRRAHRVAPPPVRARPGDCWVDRLHDRLRRALARP